MSLKGAIIAVVIGAASHMASAGIDAGGKPEATGDVAKGPVTRFGSIYVNGVHFNTDNALFVVGGEFGTEADITVGQIVTVHGSVDASGTEGTAYLVTYESAVTGPITSIDSAANSLTVLGQTIVVDVDTAIAAAWSGDSISDLNLDDVVEISGYPDADGNIVATHIASGALADGFDVRGTIASVDTARNSFTVNDLRVDYGTANLYGLPLGEPEPGQRVEIGGITVNTAGELVASQVALAADTIAAGSSDSAQIEGLITRKNDFDEFELDGTTVRVSWGTQFVDGWLFGLQTNRRVEVEGSFDSNGVLVADAIIFEKASNVYQSGHVQAVDDDSVTIGGTRFVLTSETAYEDDSDADEHRFDIGDIRTGDFVSIRGYDGNGGIVATRIERDDDDESGTSRPRFVAEDD